MPVKAEADKRASFARDVESRLDYSIVHRSPVRTCECKILVRGRVTVNMRRARRRRSRLASEVTVLPRPSGPSAVAPRPRRRHVRRPRGDCGIRIRHPRRVGRAIDAEIYAQALRRRTSSVENTQYTLPGGTTRSPASLERVISPGSRHASAHLLDRRTWCVAREPCGAAAHTSRHNSYTCPMTSPEKWSTQGHTVRFFSTASSRLCCYEALWDGGCLRDVSEMKSHRVGAGSCSARR